MAGVARFSSFRWETKSGFFENQLDSYGEAYYPNGSSYKGNWKKDLWNGYGELYNAELGELFLEYTGQFLKGW